MKTLHLLRWSGSVLSPRIRPYTRVLHPIFTVVRQQSSTSSGLLSEIDQFGDDGSASIEPPSWETVAPSPPHERTMTSSRLSALHSRLSLPLRLPLQTLARTLVDVSADPSPQFNNGSFSVLGNDLLSYYTSEFLLCTYP